MRMHPEIQRLHALQGRGEWGGIDVAALFTKTDRSDGGSSSGRIFSLQSVTES